MTSASEDYIMAFGAHSMDISPDFLPKAHYGMNSVTAVFDQRCQDYFSISEQICSRCGVTTFLRAGNWMSRNNSMETVWKQPACVSSNIAFYAGNIGNNRIGCYQILQLLKNAPHAEGGRTNHNDIRLWCEHTKVC